MKQPQSDGVAPEDLDEFDLGLVELPPGGEKAAILVAVRITEHDLLRLPSAAQKPHVIRQCEQGFHHGAGIAQVVDGLEKRDDVDVHLAVARPQEARLLQQQRDLENIGRIARLGDHIVGDRNRAVEPVRIRGFASDCKFRCRLVRIGEER